MEFLSQVSWKETGVFALMRILAASLGTVVLMLIIGNSMSIVELLLGAPLFVVFCAAVSIGTALLSKIGVPFAGLISFGSSLPL